jgi:hypothetical protein
MKQKIINYIRAGYPGLYLVSPEEQRVEAEMKQLAKDMKYNLVFWSAVDGLVDASKGSTTAANDPLKALIAIKDMKEKTLILLRDFHLFLQDPALPVVVWVTFARRSDFEALLTGQMQVSMRARIGYG